MKNLKVPFVGLSFSFKRTRVITDVITYGPHGDYKDLESAKGALKSDYDFPVKTVYGEITVDYEGGNRDTPKTQRKERHEINRYRK